MSPLNSNIFMHMPDLDNQNVTQLVQVVFSFSFRVPNAKQDRENIKEFVHTTSNARVTTIDWPTTYHQHST